MANQTITSNSNHDALTGRAAGEDITINSGAILTIDSMPHLTSMGILGDITCNDGLVFIDGRFVKNVTYSSGSGGSLPAVGATITWDSGSSQGKVIQQLSGDAASGVLVVTVHSTGTFPDEVADPLVAADTITDGTWSATVDSVAVGYLIVFGEDQDWGFTDLRATLRSRGDWYEVGVGDGSDSQTFELPHVGHQHAVWVETGSGTNVFEIWHRICSGTSATYYYQFSEFSAYGDTGHVFQQTQGDATITFGTSTQGGVVPNGARVRIPNIHIGTTSVGAPTTENTSATSTTYILLTQGAGSFDCEGLNLSTAGIYLLGAGVSEFSHCAFGICVNTTNVVAQCVQPLRFEDCAFIFPGTTAGGTPFVSGFHIELATGGVVIEDCVYYGGPSTDVGHVLRIACSRNVALSRCKLVQNRKTGTAYVITVTSGSANIDLADCALVGVALLSSGDDVSFVDCAWGYGPGRTAVTTSLGRVNGYVSNVLVDGWTMANGAIPSSGYQWQVDAGLGFIFRNCGAVDSPVDMGGVMSGIYLGAANTAPMDVKIQRWWLSNCGTTSLSIYGRSTTQVTVENFGGDYANELEMDGSDVVVRGFRGGSGGPEVGVEGDLSGNTGSSFYDCLTSATAGLVGLVFAPPGMLFAGNATTIAGTPVWTGTGSLLLCTVGDQVVYEWPWEITGHTAFTNTTPLYAGTGTANLTYEYDLDTGSGYSGSWTECTGANLSAETISAAGFRIKFRITCATAATTNALKGFAVVTTTTLSDQAANLYPLDAQTVTFTGLVTGGEFRIYDLDSADPQDQGTELAGTETLAGTTYAWEHSKAGDTVSVQLMAAGYEELVQTITLPTGDATIPLVPRVEMNI